MLCLFFGSDRNAARAALAAVLEKRRTEVLRITDAHTVSDLESALRGPGMFGAARIVVCDGLLGGANEEMRTLLAGALPRLADADEEYFLLEGALDAATKALLKKHVAQSQQFDAPKAPEEKTIFALASALQRGDKKALWIGLMREYAKGSAPEAVHGLLFWGAKQLVLKARSGEDDARGRRLVVQLAELPHLARRRGEDMSYALERFALSGL